MNWDFLKFAREWLYNDIGIDLGTANTLVYLRGEGIIINEPTVVAVNQKTNRLVAIGGEAKSMLGRTPAHLLAVRPLVGGVISDFEVTEEMLAYFISKADARSKKLLGPRVVVGVPSGITNVEIRAVRDAAQSAGAREVFIVEEPMAAAIGIKLPVKSPVGSMIIDIGGGTTDIAVLALEGVVKSKNLKVAGDRMNNDISAYIRNEFKILVGEKTAEELKIAIGGTLPGREPLEASIRGRDLITGLPREVVITDTDLREAIAPAVLEIAEAAKEVIELTPPEILSDVVSRGVFLVGGGALLRHLPEYLSEALNLPVHLAEDPLTAVARGTGIILERLPEFRNVLISNEDEIALKQA